jgi:hypothetical protein
MNNEIIGISLILTCLSFSKVKNNAALRLSIIHINVLKKFQQYAYIYIYILLCINIWFSCYLFYLFVILT